MTFLNKVLTYLGFCPSKESAQGFRVGNNTLTLKQGVVGVGFSLILILLVGAYNIYTSAVTVDTVLRVFSIIVGGIILVIVMVGGLWVQGRELARLGPWALGKRFYFGNFILVLFWGATKGFFFISPTDGWVEKIVEALVLGLMLTFVQVKITEVYSRWRKDK